MEIPTAPELATLLDGYKGKALIAQGEEFDPSFENIEKRTTKREREIGFRICTFTKTKQEAMRSTPILLYDLGLLLH